MLLGIERAVVEDVRVELEAVVVSVRPKSREKYRCGVCARRCPREDCGEGRRRWRALDLGTTFAYLEADAPRVYCKHHRVVVAAVPWARHDSRFTVAFEDQCCWLAVNTSKKAVAELMRVTWRTVGSICERVADEAIAQRDLFAGLKRIGIDDFSHRKGHRYLTVVVDHDTGRLVWAAPGRDRKTVEKFLDLLGKERCGQLELVSCDMAESIALAVADRCPNAVRCVTHFTSYSSRQTRSTRSAGRCGTKPAAPATSRQPSSSRAPASSCERTLTGSPNGNSTSSRRSSRPTSRCTART